MVTMKVKIHWALKVKIDANLPQLRFCSFLLLNSIFLSSFLFPSACPCVYSTLGMKAPHTPELGDFIACSVCLVCMCPLTILVPHFKGINFGVGQDQLSFHFLLTTLGLRQSALAPTVLQLSL